MWVCFVQYNKPAPVRATEQYMLHGAVQQATSSGARHVASCTERACSGVHERVLVSEGVIFTANVTGSIAMKAGGVYVLYLQDPGFPLMVM